MITNSSEKIPEFSIRIPFVEIFVEKIFISKSKNSINKTYILNNIFIIY